MNSFKKCQQIERQSICDIISYANSQNVQIIKTEKQFLLQKFYGDFFAKINNQFITVELKSEIHNKYQNLFLEIWSNKSQKTPGWLATSQADFLWYYFLDTKELYKYNMVELRGFVKKNYKRYTLKKQNKYKQLNDTWGYPIPIKDLESIPSFKKAFLCNQ